MYVCVLRAHLFLAVVRSVGSPRLEFCVVVSYRVVLETDLDALQKQQVFLRSEPSFQPCCEYFMDELW